MWYSTVNVMIENKDVRYSDNIFCRCLCTNSVQSHAPCLKEFCNKIPQHLNSCVSSNAEMFYKLHSQKT